MHACEQLSATASIARVSSCAKKLNMSLYNGPPRGGSRGGQDQFNWSNVKADKDREYYLGHSEKALTGRWQKGALSSL